MPRDTGKDDEPTSKGISAAARRRLLKSRATGRSPSNDDQVGYNPQTRGNKRYKVGSPAYKILDEIGEARIQETPHGPKHELGAKLPSSAIRRRMERMDARKKWQKESKNWKKDKGGWMVKPLKDRETVS